ncbi:MAG: hypothetical protein EA359_06415 [Balneolaceae bacterium]|nr:MAG: hypothetical protein EA359_06415 [Balneolaceae bacterium]
MEKARENSTLKKYSLILIVIAGFILLSCDNVNIDTAEKSESIYSEEINTLNTHFLMYNIDIKIHEIKPAGREVIAQVRQFSNKNLYLLQERGAKMNGMIRWNQTEVLTLENQDMFVAITEVRNRSDNSYKYIYSLMNHEGVIDQYVNKSHDLNTDSINSFSSDESLDSSFSFINISGLCLNTGSSTSAKMVYNDPSQFSNSTSSGCFETCVKETIEEGSTAFQLFCIATGPYCAAAIVIACGGKCAIQ